MQLTISHAAHGLGEKAGPAVIPTSHGFGLGEKCGTCALQQVTPMDWGISYFGHLLLTTRPGYRSETPWP